MELLLTSTPGYIASWWPLWAAGLLAALTLVFVGPPSRLRRVLGIALLALVPLTAYAFAVWADNTCWEVYGTSTECDLSSGWYILGFALVVGIASTVVWGLYRLVRLIASHRRDPAPRRG